MKFIDIGDGSTACPSVVRLPAGATVKNLAGSTVDYHTAWHLPADGTVGANASQTFANGGYIKSQGRTSLQLTGGPF